MACLVDTPHQTRVVELLIVHAESLFGPNEDHQLIPVETLVEPMEKRNALQVPNSSNIGKLFKICDKVCKFSEFCIKFELSICLEQLMNVLPLFLFEFNQTRTDMNLSTKIYDIGHDVFSVTIKWLEVVLYLMDIL